MRADRVFAYGAAAGLLADLLLGDPRRAIPSPSSGGPPVPWRARCGATTAAGARCTPRCAPVDAAAGAALAARAVRGSGTASTALTAATVWAVVGGTTLGREAHAVAGALAAGDLEVARERLPHLCGRDLQHLDGPGIARAVVESVAENTSDAVVGALVGRGRRRAGSSPSGRSTPWTRWSATSRRATAASAGRRRGSTTWPGWARGPADGRARRRRGRRPARSRPGLARGRGPPPEPQRGPRGGSVRRRAGRTAQHPLVRGRVEHRPVLNGQGGPSTWRTSSGRCGCPVG